MSRDGSWRGAILAAILVAAYLPVQPALAWLLQQAGVGGAEALDGLARWTSTAVVLLLGAGIAGVLAWDWKRRDGRGRMQRWAMGAVSGLAVLVFLSALLTLTQAMLQWNESHASAVALGVDCLFLAGLGAVAFFAIEDRPTLRLRGDAAS